MKPLDLNINLPDGEKVKMHFRENQKFYKGLALGVCIGLVLHRKPVQIVNNITPMVYI